MEISIYEQLLSNFYAVILGFFSWGIYELIKLVKMLFCWEYSEKFKEKMSKREFKKIKNPLNIKNKAGKNISFVITFFFDIVYFLILSIIFPIFTYITNEGIFRWYIFAFAGVGFVIPKITIGRLLNFVLEHINYYSKVLILLIVTPIYNKIINKMKKIKAKRQEKAKEKEKKEREKERKMLISYGK